MPSVDVHFGLSDKIRFGAMRAMSRRVLGCFVFDTVESKEARMCRKGIGRNRRDILLALKGGTLSTGDSIAIEPSLPRPASESSMLQFLCIDPVSEMLPIRPNVRFSLVAGSSIRCHFSATRCESMRMLFMIMQKIRQDIA